MNFDCAHCGEMIHSVSAIIDGKFIHHRCKESYENKKRVMSELLNEINDLITEEKPKHRK